MVCWCLLANFEFLAPDQKSAPLRSLVLTPCKAKVLMIARYALVLC